MSLEIKAAVSKADVRKFVDLPWTLFDTPNYPQWVPPLRMMVHDVLDPTKPFYRDAERVLFLAYRDGAAVGRIACIENRAHNRFHNDRIGFWGFFECVDDQRVANSLFGAARQWLADRSLDTMRGPVMPSTNYDCGLLISAFDQDPVFMTTWNPAYYPKLVENAGQLKSKDLIGVYVPTGDPSWSLPPRYLAFAERVKAKSDVTFRDLDMSRWEQELELCWDLYSSAWEDNWGFVPMTREEFVTMAKDLKPLLATEFAFMVAVNGVPAGFTLMLHDYNQILKRIRNGRLFPTGALKLLFGRRTITRGRVFAMGVKREFRTRGIYPLFVFEADRRLRAAGLQSSEISWVLEDNHALLGPVSAIDLHEYKRWRLYDGPTGL